LADLFHEQERLDWTRDQLRQWVEAEFGRKVLELDDVDLAEALRRLQAMA
jgi:hypothetical protein